MRSFSKSTGGFVLKKMKSSSDLRNESDAVFETINPLYGHSGRLSYDNKSSSRSQEDLPEVPSIGAENSTTTSSSSTSSNSSPLKASVSKSGRTTPPIVLSSSQPTTPTNTTQLTNKITTPHSLSMANVLQGSNSKVSSIHHIHIMTHIVKILNHL